MTEEHKERDFVEEAKVRIVGVQVITNPYDPEEVKRIVFETDKGQITHKPKMAVEEFRNGIQFCSIKNTTVDKLPRIVNLIGRQIQLNNFVNAIVCYSIWNTEKDGAPVTYRFVQYGSQLEKWRLQTEEPVTNNMS